MNDENHDGVLMYQAAASVMSLLSHQRSTSPFPGDITPETMMAAGCHLMAHSAMRLASDFFSKIANLIPNLESGHFEITSEQEFVISINDDEIRIAKMRISESDFSKLSQNCKAENEEGFEEWASPLITKIFMSIRSFHPEDGVRVYFKKEEGVGLMV